MTARVRSQHLRLIDAIRLEDIGGVHVAVIVCPFCGAEHEHVAPRSIVAGVYLERHARCDNRRGLYLIALPELAEATS